MTQDTKGKKERERVTINDPVFVVGDKKLCSGNAVQVGLEQVSSNNQQQSATLPKQIAAESELLPASASVIYWPNGPMIWLHRNTSNW